MSLASKFVLYRQEHEANGGHLKWNFRIERWDKSTDRAQIVDEKNKVKIKLTSRVMVIKM